MLPTTPANWPLLDDREDTVDYDRTPWFPPDHDERMPWVSLPEPAVDPDWQYAAESENAGPIEDDTPLCDYDTFDLWMELCQMVGESSSSPTVVPSPHVPPALLPSAMGSKMSRIPKMSEHKVMVNGEERGSDWGKGRSRAIFAAFEAENASIPLGRGTEYDLCKYLGIPFKR
jgi:hypothetical protein